MQSNDPVLGMYLFGVAPEANLRSQKVVLIRGGFDRDWLRSNRVSAQRADGREMRRGNT